VAIWILWRFLDHFRILHHYEIGHSAVGATARGVGDGGRGQGRGGGGGGGGGHVPSQNSEENIFRAIRLLFKIRAFFGQKSCKIRHFLIFFSGNNHVQNSGILLIFHRYPRLKLTELLRLCTTCRICACMN